MSTVPHSHEKGESKSSHTFPKALTMDHLGPGVTNSTNLIRGSVLSRANELKKIKEAGGKLPFDDFYPLHYGNPQLLGQPPITFIRQCIAGTFYPPLLDSDALPNDVKKRVKYYLDNIPNKAVGAYADAAGFPVFVKSVANFIAKRDGYPTKIENIYLSDGGFDAMLFVMRILFSKPNKAILAPCPAYPGYSRLVSQLNGKYFTYPLDEERGWAVNVFFYY